VTPVGSAGGAAGIREIMAIRRQILDRSQLLQQIRTPEAAPPPPDQAGPAGGFAGALRTALDGVNETQKTAEALGEAYQKGEVTDVAKVMLARQESGLAFEATLQVRNRLLSAYQEIMRMGV